MSSVSWECRFCGKVPEIWILEERKRNYLRTVVDEDGELLVQDVLYDRESKETVFVCGDCQREMVKDGG